MGIRPLFNKPPGVGHFGASTGHPATRPKMASKFLPPRGGGRPDFFSSAFGTNHPPRGGFGPRSISHPPLRGYDRPKKKEAWWGHNHRKDGPETRHGPQLDWAVNWERSKKKGEVKSPTMGFQCKTPLHWLPWNIIIYFPIPCHILTFIETKKSSAL